jgi:hypothetical protein
MKISLALGPRQELSRQTAWGCLTANVALPGSGSLLAGRATGYPQLGLALGGLALSLLFGLRFIVWYIANWSHFYGPQADPFSAMGDIWFKMRWALLGIGVFALGWLWALATSLAIVQSAKNAEKAAVPPRL